MHFPTRNKNTLDLLLTFLPGQFQDIHSSDKLSAEADLEIMKGGAQNSRVPNHRAPALTPF